MPDFLPDLFVERLREIVPPDWFRSVMGTFQNPAATGFRVNGLRASAPEVVQELSDAGLEFHGVPWKEDAFWAPAEERQAVLSSAAFEEHRIYVQNLSSMIPPLVLDPQPDERVLDLAAAPGSKTLQIAEAMEDRGELAAVELVKGRFFKMKTLLDAYGATSVRTFLRNGETVWRVRPEHFDRVLLDAPCSTEGRFHVSDPETWSYWSPRKIKEMVRKQQRLLYSAVRSLRPGGVLVYSTCTFAPEENEGVLERMFGTFGDALTLEPLGLELENMMPPLQSWRGRAFEADLRHARRVLPTPEMEGFFVAQVRKS